MADESLVSATDIVIDALQKLNVYAPGETLSAADATRGFQALLDLIDQWSNDSLYIYQAVPIVIPLQPGVMSYTIGPNSNVPVPLPLQTPIGPDQVKISSNGVSFSFASIVSSMEWYALYKPKPSDFQTVPTVMWYDARLPWSIVAFSPVPGNTPPTLAATFNAYYAGAIFDPVTEYLLAPGVRVALASNLAVFLNSYFGSTQLTPELITQAQQSKTTLTLTYRLSRAMSKRNIEPPAPGITPKQ